MCTSQLVLVGLRIWWVLLEEDLDLDPWPPSCFVEQLKCGDGFDKASSPRPHDQMHWVAVVWLDDWPLMTTNESMFYIMKLLVILPPYAPLFISFLKAMCCPDPPIEPLLCSCALLCRWGLKVIHKRGNNSIITSLTLEKWKKAPRSWLSRALSS